MKNGDDVFPWALWHKGNAIQIQANRPLGCFSEQLLENLKLKIDALGYRLTVLHPISQADKQYGHDCLITISVPYHVRERGVATEKGRGFSGPNASQIPMSTIPNHSIHQLRFPSKISNWMRWITLEWAYPAIQCCTYASSVNCLL